MRPSLRRSHRRGVTPLRGPDGGALAAESATRSSASPEGISTATIHYTRGSASLLHETAGGNPWAEECTIYHFCIQDPASPDRKPWGIRAALSHLRLKGFHRASG